MPPTIATSAAASISGPRNVMNATPAAATSRAGGFTEEAEPDERRSSRREGLLGHVGGGEGTRKVSGRESHQDFMRRCLTA